MDYKGKCFCGLWESFFDELVLTGKQNKAIVIGVASGVGALILFSILSCCWSRCRASRRKTKNLQHYNVAPVRTGGPQQGWTTVNPQQNWNPQQQQQSQSWAPNAGPPNWNNGNGGVSPPYEQQPQRNRTFRGHGQRTSETAVSQNDRYQPPVRYA